jgi:hypothetical protein
METSAADPEKKVHIEEREEERGGKEQGEEEENAPLTPPLPLRVAVTHHTPLLQTRLGSIHDSHRLIRERELSFPSQTRVGGEERAGDGHEV